MVYIQKLVDEGYFPTGSSSYVSDKDSIRECDSCGRSINFSCTWVKENSYMDTKSVCSACNSDYFSFIYKE